MEPKIEYFLTTQRSREHLHVSKAIHTSLMPEYPETHPDGLIYVISTAGQSPEHVARWTADVSILESYQKITGKEPES